MANIRPKDTPRVTAVTAGDTLLLDGATTRSIQVKDIVGTRGADIASAATIDLETPSGQVFDITGTTGITAITLADGHRRLTRFTGAVAITAGASLLPPYGASYTTNAGDVIEWEGYAGGIVRAIDVQQPSLLSARAAIVAAPFDAAAQNGMQINGAMEVSQESGTTAVTLTGTGALQFKYLLDGVMAGYRGTFVATAQQVAAPAGMPAKSALKITVGTAQAVLGANDELTIMLPIEGMRTSRLLLGTALAAPQSLGFWFSSHRTGAFSGSIMNAAKTRAFPFSFTVAVADTPQWISFSRATANEILADTAGTWLNDTNVGTYVSICLAGGTSRVGAAGAWGTTASPGLVGVTGTSNGVGAVTDVFYLSNLISLPGLELPSSDRAPFIMRPFDQELLLARRHLQMRLSTSTAEYLGMVQATSTTGASGPIWDLKPEMRAAPTVTVSANGDISCTAANGAASAATAHTFGVSPQAVRDTITVPAVLVAGNASIAFLNSATAFLKADARLI